MVTGIGRFDLYLPDKSSLKAKRQILKSLKTRLRNKFNISVSEVEGHDLWQRSVLGIAVVSDDTRFVNEVLEKVKNYIDMEREVQILDIKFEIL